LKFEKFCHFFEGSIATPESFQIIPLKERYPMDVGKESKASKNYRKNSEKNHFKQFRFFFSSSPPLGVGGQGVKI
jgi:hypothetical protein